MSRPEQYVGISGVVSREQQRIAAEYARNAGVGELGAFVMSGVQASSRTQIDEEPTDQGEGWHPVGANIKAAGEVDDTGLIRSFIHIYGGDKKIERQKRTIEATVYRTAEFQSGIQLNRLDWQLPEYDEFMQEVRSNKIVGEDCAIVLQCHERAMKALEPAALTERLQRLAPDYVLFDVSHGAGKFMDTEDLRRYIDDIYQKQLDVGVAIAGGLDGPTLQKAQENEDSLFRLFESFPDLSCDAEGKLRSGESGATYLDMDKVRHYLSSWVNMMRGIKSVQGPNDEPTQL